MPLDPEIAEVLTDYYRELPDTVATIEEARRIHEVTLVETLGRSIIDGIDTTDLTIPGEAGPIRARTYRPADTPQPEALIIFLHGGSWMFGSIDSYDAVTRRLARHADAVVVSIEYRLAPEHPFPAGWNDCQDAIAWIAEHAGDLGGPRDRIVLAGDSAGGNLAAAHTVHARDHGIPIAGLLLFYPSCDLSKRYPSMDKLARGYLLETPTVDFPDRAYLVDRKLRTDPRVSPIFADLHDLPPTVIYTAEYDPLKDHGSSFASAICAAGGTVTFRESPGMIHAYLHAGRSAAAGAEVARACRDLIHLVRGEAASRRELLTCCGTASR